MSNENEVADPSPTGFPVMPQWFVKASFALVAVAGVVMQAVPEHTIAWRIAAGVTSVGAALGIASQGVRR